MSKALSLPSFNRSDQLNSITISSIANFDAQMDKNRYNVSEEMTVRIAVCDDESYIIELMKKMLKKAEKELDASFSCSFFASGNSLMETKEDFDIVFLDIGMGEQSGMEIAKTLRSQGFDGILIFVTTLTQYALEGYSVHAYEFICKPLEYGRLHNTLRNCIRILSSRTFETVRVTYGPQVYNLDITHILYFEVFDHFLEVNMDNGKKIQCSGTLSEFEEKLSDRHFYRCYQSFLINLRFVDLIAQKEVVVAGAHIPLSKYKRKGLLDAFASYRESLL